MSIETMSFILGGILLAAALFGGRLEVKELKVPQIGTFARILCALAGLSFVGLALYVHGTPASSNSSVPTSDAKKTYMTFPEPMLGDLRLDACLEWGRNCGEPAATAWCKTKGMTRATEYPGESVGERGIGTRLIGTQQVCREKYCVSFGYIVCEK